MPSVFRAVVCTVVPEASDLDENGWRELEALVEDTLQGQSRSIRRQIRLFLGLVQWLPLFRHGRPFTSLAPQRRASFLSYLQNHPTRVVRVGFWGLRSLVLLGYYGRAAAADAIGYRPDPRGWDALK